MAETPDIPQSLQAIIKVLNSIGADLQIPIRQGNIQRFVSGDKIVPIFNDKSQVWDIGYQSKGGKTPEYKAIPGASLPFGSYGPLLGKPAVLNIKGTNKKTLGGASIIDRAVAALENPEVAKRVQAETGYSPEKLKANFRSNLAAPTRTAGMVTDLIFPSGRNPDVGERKKLEALYKAGLISKNEDGKFVNRSRPLSKEENQKAMEIMRPGSTTGTRAPSTPSLQRVEPKELTRLAKELASKGLREPPTAIDNRDTRQAEAEAKKYQAQRDSEEGKRPEFRGSKPASPSQKDMVVSLLASLKEKDPNAYLKFLQQNPEFREQLLTKKGPLPAGPLSKAAEDKLAELNLRVQVGSTGGEVRVGGEGRRSGLTVTGNTPPMQSAQPIASSVTTGEEVYGPGNYLTKSKAGALINALMSLGQRIPKNPQLGTGAEALAILPRLPAQGVGGADVESAMGASRFAGAQPLAMTPEQAAMPIQEKSAARQIVDVSRRIQQGFTKDQETKLVGEIDKAIKALGEASPSNALEKAKLAIRLAKKQVAFGNTADLSGAQKEFVDMTIAQVNRIKSDLGNPEEKIRKQAEAQRRMLEAAGFSELDPKSVSEQAKYLWTLNTAGAAVRALDLKGRELKPQEQDITSKRIEPFIKDTGEVGSKIGTPPTLISPMQVSDYASNLRKAGEARVKSESNRRAARGEKRVVPTDGLSQTQAEPEKGPPEFRKLPGTSRIAGLMTGPEPTQDIRYIGREKPPLPSNPYNLPDLERLARMPEPVDEAVVARGRSVGRPRNVAESLLVQSGGPTPVPVSAAPARGLAGRRARSILDRMRGR